MIKDLDNNYIKLSDGSNNLENKNKGDNIMLYEKCTMNMFQQVSYIAEKKNKLEAFESNQNSTRPIFQGCCTVNLYMWSRVKICSIDIIDN